MCIRRRKRVPAGHFRGRKTSSDFAGIEFYLPYFYESSATLLDYLPEHALIVADDWQELEAITESFEQQAEQVRDDLESRGEIPRNLMHPYFAWNELRDRLLQHSRILFDYRGVEEAPGSPFARVERFGGQVKRVVDEMMAQRANGSRCSGCHAASRTHFRPFARPRALYQAENSNDTAPEPGHVALVQGALTEGWRTNST